MRRIVLFLIALAGFASARAETVRFLRWNEAQPVLAGIATPAEVPPELTDARAWDGWIRQRDAELRRATERSIEDSISMLILAGTSFTNLPKLVAAEDAVNPAGDLTPAARIRVSTFIDALDHVDGEPFRYILQFLARHRITQDELRAYLSGNLRRAVLERNHDQGNRPAALARTAIDETLRRVQMDGKAPPAIRRICVIAPDLDLGIDPGAFDVSVLEAVQRLGLTKPGNAEVVALDFNPWVLSQVRAKSGAQNRARIRVQDLNVAAQTIDMPVNQGFELVVAINGLVRGGNLDHALAAANVARMMATGGILLTKGPPPTLPGEFELLPAGPGEGIAVYRRR